MSETTVVRGEFPSQQYQNGVATGRWQDDHEQRVALVQLDRIYCQFAEPVRAFSWEWLKAYFGGQVSVQGLYLWGGVGRGKTFLMDLFYQTVPAEQKLRLHFHRFMQRVHAELKQLAGREDPLREVAAHFRSQARLLCLDEFYVSDIGDAMLLGRLLKHLIADGVILVATSNIRPSQLYRDGLQRSNFLPAITLIEQYCQIVELASPRDYRLRALTQAPLYHQPLGTAAESELKACFDRIAVGLQRPEREITVNERKISTLHRADGVIWFDFDALCSGPRAVDDYIELARRFHSVLISNVPQFTELLEDQARRFINLVDEFYDRNVNLILSAEAPIAKLYAGEKLRAEFTRTISRLIEMQSADYLAREHKP